MSEIHSVGPFILGKSLGAGATGRHICVVTIIVMQVSRQSETWIPQRNWFQSGSEDNKQRVSILPPFHEEESRARDCCDEDYRPPKRVEAL